MAYKIVALLFFFIFSNSLVARSIDLNYGKWKIKYSCKNRGYEFFHYKTVDTIGDKPVYTFFRSESVLPEKCQQFSTEPYESSTEPRYVRGYGVHQRLWDHDKGLMIDTNRMSNILPHASELATTGLWKITETLTDCWRTKGEVEVWGGVFWGKDKSNDHFMESHGVTTPDELWKVIKYPDGSVNAWIMPNNNTPTFDNMNTYLVAPVTIAKRAKVKIKVAKAEYKTKDTQSLGLPEGC